jgi:hypothetical protein
MKRHTRNLITGLLGATALTAFASAPSFALDLPAPLQYDMGTLLGKWKIAGGVEAALSGWNNATQRDVAGVPGGVNNADAAPGVGGGTTGDIDLTNAIFILSNDSFGKLPLSFNAWVGEPPNTPVVGYTSGNVAPNLYSTEGKGPNQTGHASFLFKGWATLQPLDWFSVQAGRLPSVDGTEIGVGFLNELPMLTDLNNMQTTVADGAQINLISGPDQAFYYGFLPGYGSTLTVRVADGYKTGHANELGFTGLWNLTPDGSDFIVGYGHTRLSTVGNASTIAGGIGTTNGGVNGNAVGGFGVWNSDLIGIGTVYNLTNRLMMNAEIETAWLPTSAIPAADRCGTAAGVDCHGNNNQDYHRYSAQVTLAYDFGISHVFGDPVRTSYAIQEEYTSQHGNSSDPNSNILGDYLGIGAGAPSNSVLGQATNTADFGTFGAGASMWGFQTGPTFQIHNAFLRPTFSWTHLADIAPGFGYGNRGNDKDQFVVMLDFGWLLGKLEKGDTGQP